MGNLDSKYKYEHGSIYCQTDKEYFVAGEQITGKVYLNLTMMYPASTIEIEVSGKEKCKWKTRESKQVKEGENSKTEFVDVTHKNEKKVINYKVPVFYFPGGAAPPGQFTFPFSFALPSNIPASLYWSNIDGAAAKIKYKFKASLEAGMGWNVKTMKHKQTLIIRQPKYNHNLNPMQTDTRNVYACCCFGNKGQAKITTQFEKDGYNPDEVCRAMVDLDNSQCRGAANSVSISLEQHVELRAKDGEVYNDRRVLEQKNFDGLAANTATGGLNRYLELQLSSIKQQPRSFDDHKPLAAEDRHLAERIQPTADGATVKLYYRLTVRANYGSVCAEEPHCTIPLTITPPPLPNFHQIEAPPGWNPTIFSAFEFSLPGPGEVMTAAAQAVAPISGNLNINFGANEEFKMGGPNVHLSIDTDKINQQVPLPGPPPMPAQPQNVHMNMNMPGLPGMNMNMEVSGSATYHSETKVNGVTTSSTTYSAEVPAPVPVPAPMPAPGPANAQFTMNTNLGMHAHTSADDGHASAHVNFGGMNMGVDMKVDNSDSD